MPGHQRSRRGWLRPSSAAEGTVQEGRRGWCLQEEPPGGSRWPQPRAIQRPAITQLSAREAQWPAREAQPPARKDAPPHSESTSPMPSSKWRSGGRGLASVVANAAIFSILEGDWKARMRISSMRRPGCHAASLALLLAAGCQWRFCVPRVRGARGAPFLAHSFLWRQRFRRRRAIATLAVPCARRAQERYQEASACRRASSRRAVAAPSPRRPATGSKAARARARRARGWPGPLHLQAVRLPVCLPLPPMLLPCPPSREQPAFAPAGHASLPSLLDA